MPPPGVTAIASTAPAAAAGSASAAAAARARPATWRSDAPRARITANSAPRRVATRAAPSSTATMPMTARLTNSRLSTAPMAWSWPENALSAPASPLLSVT